MTEIRKHVIPVRVTTDEKETITENAMAHGYEHPTGGKRSGPNIGGFLRDAALRWKKKKSV